MKLWLVRHAQPLVEKGLCYGRLDMPADTNATRQCAETLAELLPYSLQVRSSPLQRCEQLVPALLALRSDLACKQDLRLREMDFGTWEGLAWDTIGQQELESWTRDFANHRAGASGESVSGLMKRVAQAYDETIASDQDTLWITHAGVIRAVELIAAGQRNIERADQWPTEGPAYGQWRTLEI